MNLFASDYDGTFCKNDVTELNDNSESIRRWRDNGNQFAFATGRGITPLRNEISELNLTFDYIIGLNGAIIIDNEDNILYQATIKTEIASEIISYIVKENFLSFMISDGFTGTFNINKEDNNLREMQAKLQDKGLFNLSLIESLLRPISQISIVCLTQEEVCELSTQLSNLFKNEVIIYPNRTSIDISPKHTSKANGIQKLSKLSPIHFNQIYCIGDSWNDIEMIERFNGYAMIESPHEIKAKSSKTFNTVNEAIYYTLQKEKGAE